MGILHTSLYHPGGTLWFTCINLVSQLGCLRDYSHKATPDLCRCIIGRVDVFLDLCEKVIPSSNDLALVLVVYQLKLVGLPRLSHLAEERERGRDGMQTERKKRQRWRESNSQHCTSIYKREQYQYRQHKKKCNRWWILFCISITLSCSSAILLNTVCRLIRYSCIYTVHVSDAVNTSLAIQHGDAIKHTRYYTHTCILVSIWER